MLTTYNKGIFAEWFLIFLLIIKGYKILAHRYKTKLGEIDVIASKNKNLKIFEVKSRSKGNFELGSDNVRVKQRSRIEMATKMFLSKHNKYLDYNISYSIFLFNNIFNYKFFE